MKFKLTFFIMLSFLSFAYGQESEEKEKPSTLWKQLIGKPLETSVTFLPTGTHTKDVDVFGVWYTAYNYKSVEIAAFSNSFEQLTIGLFYKREIAFTEKFSFIYSAGFLHGYHGRLQDVKGIPFRDSFLFTGEINPVVGLELDYKVSKKLSLHGNITPLIIIYGLRYRL